MIFNLKYPNDAKAAYAYLDNLMENQAKVEIKKKSPIRSLAANRYLHLILGYFSVSYGCSLDETKVDFYKRTCNREIFERERENKDGKMVKYLRSSATLDSKEFALSVDRFRSWSAMEAGIYLPAPNEEQFLEFCQREIERCAEYV